MVITPLVPIATALTTVLVDKDLLEVMGFVKVCDIAKLSTSLSIVIQEWLNL